MILTQDPVLNLPSARRNTNLDALRALAILMVIGRHFDYSTYWTRVGWAGVDLFFVLSGFLVSGLLFTDSKERGRICKYPQFRSTHK
jgi:peptidoglycan/LPS O-acetylase OafA/YrhL